MIPAIRLPNVFCRPKPTARPSAPEKTASAVRSMPARSMPTKKAMAMIAIAASFWASSCWVGSSPWSSLDRLAGEPDREAHQRVEREQADHDLDQSEQGEAAAAEGEARRIERRGQRRQPADRLGEQGREGGRREQPGDPARQAEAADDRLDQQRRAAGAGDAEQPDRQRRPGIDARARSPCPAPAPDSGPSRRSAPGAPRRACRPSLPIDRTGAGRDSARRARPARRRRRSLPAPRRSPPCRARPGA